MDRELIEAMGALEDTLREARADEMRHDEVLDAVDDDVFYGEALMGYEDYEPNPYDGTYSEC